jgi:hypothetical protein
MSRPFPCQFVFAAALLAALLAVQARAQTQASQPAMGSVATHDAVVSGGLEVQGERARLLTNVSITANDHTAAIDLARGGQALVCSTSQFHLLHSGAAASLLFGLDRGAIEIHSLSQPQDVILTPDIRFTLETPGEFNLRLRVTANGDTCVDNSGAHAPVLILSDPFSSATYRIIPGQHVLFERGSLKEVVDNESSSCGCPAPPTAPVFIAAATPAARAEAEHPFPAAVSAGLAPPPVPNNVAPPGQTSAQVTATFTHGDTGAPNPTPAAPAPAPVQTVSTAPPPTPPGAHDLAGAFAHFFHKLFHPHDKKENRKDETTAEKK